jgi:hypothetical protein
VTAGQRLLLGVAAAIFFVAHAAALPRTLEDLDSINFAMGVESFDVPAHQPHPPGYPVYIALGKLSSAALTVIAPSWDRDTARAGTNRRGIRRPAGCGAGRPMPARSTSAPRLAT